MAIQRKDSSTMSHRIFTVTAIVAGIACICSAHAQVTQSCSQISIASNSPAGANGVTAPAGGASGTLSALPSSAQPVVSATLGRKDRRYHFSSTGPAYDALRSTNRVQSLDARFTEGGIELRSGGQRFAFRLRGFGYGDRLQPVLAATPHSDANRLEYHRGSLIEWYVNGPIGLEQGFTLTQAPKRTIGMNGKPLTLAIGITGDLQVSLDGGSTKDSNPGIPGLTLRDKHGNAVLHYRGLTAQDAHGRQLRAWLELRHNELQLEVADANAQYPIVVDPIFQTALLALGRAEQLDSTPNSGAGTFYPDLGYVVAVSGDGQTIAVSQYTPVTYCFSSDCKETAWTLAGSVDIYKYTSSGGDASFPFPTWKFSKTLAQNTSLGYAQRDNGFGSGLALSCDGSVLAVGAAGEADVYVNLVKTAKLAPSDGGTIGNYLGADSQTQILAISGDGNTVVAGAPTLVKSGGVGSDPGAAYVFVKGANGWADSNEKAKLTGSDSGAYDNLGTSVATSSDGSTIVAGAPYNNSKRGAVYVFTKPSGGWASEHEKAKLTASDTVSNWLGYSVATNSGGGTVVAGAPISIASANSPPGPGSAYVFVEPTGGWASETEKAKLTASDAVGKDFFGWSVALTSGAGTVSSSPAVALVGAPNADYGRGAVYAYYKPFGGWATTSNFGDKLLDFSATWFGTSVSVGLDLTTVGVGAPFSYGVPQYYGSGTAYAFTGKSPVSVSVNNLNFGNVAIGAKVTQTVTLTNNSSQPLNFSNLGIYPMIIAIDPANPSYPSYTDDNLQSDSFSSTANCAAASPVAAGASCTETLTFAPVAPGTRTAMFVLTDDSGGVTCAAGGSYPCNTQVVQLGGTGVLTFGSNTSISSITPSPSFAGSAVTVGYSVAAAAGSTLVPSGPVTVSASTGESCVGVAPTGSCLLTFFTAGKRNIASSYFGNDSLSASISPTIAQTVTDFTIVASPTSQSVIPGKTATYNLTLNSVNGFSGAVSLGCGGGPAGATCSVTPATLNLSGSAQAQAILSMPAQTCASGGTFTIVFTGKYGTASRTSTATVTVR